MSFDISPYLHRSEGQHFDRKSLFHGRKGDKKVRDRRTVRDQIAKYVAAFANAEGGVLVMGIEDDGSVTGHRYPPDAVEMMLKVPEDRLNPPQQKGFVVEVEDKELLVFDILASSGPVQVVGDGYPLRIGDQTVQASMEQIQGMKFQGLMESFEGRASQKTLDDLDDELIERAKEGAGLQEISDEDYLKQRRLGDWRGDQFVLRQAAELLFVDGLPEHPNAGIRIFRVVGTERKTGIEHNVEELDRVEGPLPSVLAEAFQVISGILRNPSRLTAGGKFKQVSEYPEFSWKEAILNAVGHRDYSITGRGVEVWLFDDRMEVSSPGELLPEITIDRLLSLERVHASRNPRIVRTLVDLGFMRDQGEGIPRMFAEMEAQFLPQPELQSSESEIRLTLRNSPAISSSDRTFIESVGDVDLSEHEFRALFEAFRQGRVDNARLRSVTGLDTLASSMVLRGLRDRGLLELHPAGSASYYTLHPDIDSDEDFETDRGELEADRGEHEADRGELEADRGELEADRGELEADRGEYESDRGELEANRGELTEAERKMISELGTRPRKEKLRKVILELAQRRAWKPAELAEVLGGRNVRRLAEAHLGPMCDEGLLKRTNPDKPTDPNQAYYTTQASLGPLFDRDEE